jgi:hypothetical protein
MAYPVNNLLINVGRPASPDLNKKWAWLDKNAHA